MAGPFPISNVSLASLSLDLTNYRFAGAVVDEHEAILYMLQTEKILDLANNILRDGYLDNELPLVVAKESGYEVLEGNRRVTALKVLTNPALANSFGETIANRIERLTKKYSRELVQVPTEIRVMVAPSREEVQPLIARLHTRESKKKWSTEQQAKFYFTQIERGISVERLKARYDLGGRLKRLLQTGSFFGLVDSLRHRLSSEEIKLLNSLRASPLEYAFKIQQIRELTGIAFTSDGLFAPSGSTPEQVASKLTSSHINALIRLATLMTTVEPRLNTRHPALKGDAEALEAILEYLSGEAICSMPPSDGQNDMSDGPLETKESKEPSPGGTEKQPEFEEHKDYSGATTHQTRPDLTEQLREGLRTQSRNVDDRLGTLYLRDDLVDPQIEAFKDVNALLIGIFDHGTLPRDLVKRRSKLYLITPALRSVFELTLIAWNECLSRDLTLPNPTNQKHFDNVTFVKERLLDKRFLTHLSEKFPKYGGYLALQSIVHSCNFPIVAGHTANLSAHTSYSNLSEANIKNGFNEAVFFALLCQWYASYKLTG